MIRVGLFVVVVGSQVTLVAIAVVMCAVGPMRVFSYTGQCGLSGQDLFP